MAMAIFRFTERPFFNPWAELERLRLEMERMAGGAAEAGLGGVDTGVFPPLRVTEDKDNLYVRAEVPGIATADLDLSIEAETLTISGERKQREIGDKASYHRRELQYGKFNRALTLPTKINVERVTARVEDGILTITLPKAKEVKPKRIAVAVA